MVVKKRSFSLRHLRRKGLVGFSAGQNRFFFFAGGGEVMIAFTSDQERPNLAAESATLFQHGLRAQP